MRTSSLFGLAFLLLFGVSRSAPGAEKTIYVPYVWSLIGSDPGRLTYWVSGYTAANDGSETATLFHVASYGGGFLPTDPIASESCSSASTTSTLPPDSRRYVQMCVNKAPDRGVGFLEFRSAGPARLAAWVSRVDYRLGCEIACPGDGCTVSIPQGRYAIPVYDTLFPAGSRAVSNDIALGSLELPLHCDLPNQMYIRRLNVTLFNPGSVAATFAVRLRTFRTGATPILEQEVSVAPRDVVQLNRLAIPLDEAGGPDRNTPLVWVEVTANQPFLSYVSTVFDDGAPGSLPFEVQGMHLVP